MMLKKQKKNDLIGGTDIDKWKWSKRERERKYERDLGSESKAYKVNEREKTELQIALRGWSSSMPEAFHDGAVSRVRIFTSNCRKRGWEEGNQKVRFTGRRIALKEGAKT